MTKKISHDSLLHTASSDFMPDEADVAKARDELVDVQKKLVIRPALPARARKLAAVFWTVPTEALLKAADLARTHEVTEFDAAEAEAAASYERRVGSVLAEARILVQRLEDEMIVRREPPARATYALYAALKGLARIRQHDRLGAAVRELGLYLLPGRGKKSPGNAPPTPGGPLAGLAVEKEERPARVSPGRPFLVCGAVHSWRRAFANA